MVVAAMSDGDDDEEEGQQSVGLVWLGDTSGGSVTIHVGVLH